MLRCAICQGTKQILGMGMLMTKCHGCNGVGLVEKVLTRVAKISEDVEIVADGLNTTLKTIEINQGLAKDAPSIQEKEALNDDKGKKAKKDK